MQQLSGVIFLNLPHKLLWMLITLVIIVISVTAAVLIFYMLINDSPWLTNGGLTIGSIRLNSDSMLVVSDLHVDANSSDLSIISELVKRSGVGVMVIAGDLFDRRIKVNDREFRVMLRWLIQKLKLSGNNGKLTLIYVRSESSHDPEVENSKPIKITRFSNVLVISVPRVIKVNFPNCSHAVYVTHGDYTVSDGLLAGLINIVSLSLLKLPIVELMTRSLLNVTNDDWVIIGHTHLPVIDSKLKVANPGSWKGIFFTKPYNGYIIVKCVNGRLMVKSSRVKSSI